MTFHGKTIRPPSLDDLSALSKRFGYKCSEDELKIFEKIFHETVNVYDRIDRLVEPRLPVKYPRLLGHRPTAEEDPLNAWYWKCEIHGAPNGILKGKRIALKDTIALAGIPMMVGSKQLEGYIPEFDATVVTRILDAGGIIVGKAVTEDFCFGQSSFLTAYGPVKNPINPNYSAGGSSSGCGAVVGAGEADMAVGGDAGGSIRIPASRCGIVGMKPTFGLVPFTGTMSAEATLEHLGPMAKTVADCALLLEAIAGFDEGRDFRQTSSIKTENFIEKIGKPVGQFRLGILKEGIAGCDLEVQEIFEAAVQKIEKSGKFAEVKKISIPVQKDAFFMFVPIIMEGAFKNVLQNYGVGCNFKGSHSTSMTDAIFKAFKTYPADLQPNAKLISLWAAYVQENYGSHFYAKCQSLVHQLRKNYDDAFQDQKIDAFLLPTIPNVNIPLPNEGENLEVALKQVLGIDFNTASFNATGHPALNIPAGRDSNGMPVGMQIVGRKFEDGKILQIGDAIEKIFLQ